MQGINTQLLDEGLGKLKSIGLKELGKTTKLATSKIEDILEKRFDKIDRVRAKGFITILEREYGVDLRDWLLLQEQARGGDVKSVAEVITKQDEEERTQKLAENAIIVQEKEKEKKNELQKEQKERANPVIELALVNEPTSKSHAESYSWLYVIVGVILFVLIGYFAYKAFVQDNHSAQPIESSATQGANDGHYDGVFFDTTKPLEGGEQAILDTQNLQAQSSQAADSKQSLNTQAQNTQQLNNHPEQDFFFNPKPTTDATSQVNTQGKQQVNDNVLHIQAEQDLWLGVINLETGSKEQFAYKKEYDIPLGNKMLFVMGHSVFKLTLNGEEIPHGSKHPVRMYYDGSSLVDVNYTRFKQLNGGSEW